MADASGWESPVPAPAGAAGPGATAVTEPAPQAQVPAAEPQPEPANAAEPQPRSEPTAAPAAEPEAKPEPTAAKPEAAPAAEAQPKEEPEAEPRPEAEQGPPEDAAVVAKLREYLTDDSMTMDVTERQLRTRLEEHFGVPLKDRKSIIRAEVVEWLSAKQEADGQKQAEEGDGEAGAADDPAPKKRKRKGGGLTAKCLLSEPMQAFLGRRKMARTKVSKKLWAYIKANDLQNPKDRRKIILDDKLKTLFTSPLDMFSMNKQLSKHVYVDDNPDPADDEEDSSSEEEAAAPKKPRKVKGERKGSSFSRPLAVSPEMSAWLGGDAQVTRGELQKRFWAYVKQHELQNPANRKEILCDEALRSLTGQAKFANGFSFGKHVNQHLLGFADEQHAGGVGGGAEADGGKE